MRKYLVEFIGTFFLVLTIGLTVNAVTAIMAPVAIGAVLIAMIYAGGHISGAHYNPAITLAIFIRKKIGGKDALFYIVAQLAGATLASFAAMNLIVEKIPSEVTDIPTTKALLAEFIGTFALAFVILNVATSKSTAGNNYFGWAIGLTVTAMAYSLGGVSGGVFNPAVGLGIIIMKMTFLDNWWIFLVGNFSGAVVAALVFNFVNGKEE